MDDPRALLKFNDGVNAFFSSRLIIVDRTISSFLALLAGTPELMAIVTDCARTTNFNQEFAKAIVRDGGIVTLALPHNKRHLVAFVVGLLFEFDKKNLSIVEFVTKFFPNEASHASYMTFCDKVMRPFAEAFRAQLTGEDKAVDEAPPIEDKPVAHLTDKAKEDCDYWLRALLDAIVANGTTAERVRTECVTMIKGFLYALELDNPLLLKIVWIGLKNTLGNQTSGSRELKEVEMVLLTYGVID